MNVNQNKIVLIKLLKKYQKVKLDNFEIAN